MLVGQCLQFQRSRSVGPPRLRGRLRSLRLVKIFPGRAHDRIPGRGTDEQLVQLRHQSVALLLVDDEREVQIVGRLADQMDTLFLEQRQRIP